MTTEGVAVTVVEFSDRKHYQMQWRCPRTGKKKTKSTGVLRSDRAKARREAERVAENHQKELEATDYRLPTRLTWEQFRERYDKEVMQSLALGTQQKINGVLDAVEDIIHPQRLQDVDEQRISHYQAELRGKKLAEDTIRGHLAHLQAALRWAMRNKFLKKAPHIDMPRRTKARGKRTIAPMKGRPISAEEFERMLDKATIVLCPRGSKPGEAANASPKGNRRLAMQNYQRYLQLVATLVGDTVPDDATSIREAAGRSVEQLAADVEAASGIVESWRHYLRGMWFSGLRLEESLALYWDRPDRLCIDLDGDHPMLHIPAELEKGHQDRTMAVAPEFATFLLATPEAERTGPVFNPRATRVHGQRLTAGRVGTMVRRIGKAAGIKVHVHPTTGRVKFASIHDLRRSFGERWASKVMPETLMELMRHEHLDTTMRYYVGRNAQRTARVLWEAYNRDAPSNTSSNICHQQGASEKSGSVTSSCQ